MLLTSTSNQSSSSYLVTNCIGVRGLSNGSLGSNDYVIPYPNKHKLATWYCLSAKKMCWTANYMNMRVDMAPNVDFF